MPPPNYSRDPYKVFSRNSYTLECNPFDHLIDCNPLSCTSERKRPSGKGNRLADSEAKWAALGIKECPVLWEESLLQ